jgi:hypothetical protein
MVFEVGRPIFMTGLGSNSLHSGPDFHEYSLVMLILFWCADVLWSGYICQSFGGTCCLHIQDQSDWGKVKVVPMPWSVWGSGSIDPHFLDLGTSWRPVVSFTPRPLYPRVKRPGTHWTGDWVDRSGRRGENSWPYRDSKSDPSIVQPIASRYTDYAILDKEIHKSLRKSDNSLESLCTSVTWLEGHVILHYCRGFGRVYELLCI